MLFHVRGGQPTPELMRGEVLISLLNLPLLITLEYHILGLLMGSTFQSGIILTSFIPLKAINQIAFFLIPFDCTSILLLSSQEIDLGGEMAFDQRTGW